MKTWDERIDEVWDDATGEEVGDDKIARNRRPRRRTRTG